MSSMKILTVALLPLVVAGCTSQSKGGPAAATPGQKTSTTAAARVPGDLVPTTLVALNVPKPTESTVLQGSDPLAPLKPFAMATPPEPVVGRDLHRVMKGTDPSDFVVPVDSPVGARFIIRPLDPQVNFTTVHLVDVSTGRQLDLARDETAMGVNTTHTPTAGGSPGGLRDARGTPSPQAAGPVEREPGFTPLTLHTRVLSFDVPFSGGLVRIAVPADVGKSGILVELQQPNSHITLSGVPDELAHAMGDTATVTCGVNLDAAGVDGARVTGWVELPGHVHGPELSFDSPGGGQYVSHISLAGADPATMGAWGLHLRATGTANGMAFERDVESGFGFYPAHAQMTAFGPPVIERGSDGLIDSVSFDVDIQTLRDDRFSVRGTLTYTDSTGAEHPLASAQTGQLVTAGNGTLTLRFDASSMALANVNGPFNLRDVALVSQGLGTTMHRLGRGLDIVTTAIAYTDIRYPAVLSLATQDLVANGDLKLRQ